MKVSIRKVSNQALLLRMQGCLDATQFNLLNLGLDHVQWEAQNIPGQPALVVDLGEVSFLDSSGLKILAGRLQPGQGQPHSVRMVWPRSHNVRRVLELVRFDRHFPFVSDLNQALDDSSVEL